MNSPIQEYLTALLKRLSSEKGGKVADYIPELTKSDPDWFGICLATTDGKVYEVGDSRQMFTIQSISKPFAYGMALEDNGRDEVLGKVGVEPTGDAFNSISLNRETGRPANPMINAGAIATTNLVNGETTEEKVQRILATFGLYTGRELTINEEVYKSEASTGHRNRAISHLLRNFGIISSEPEVGLDAYFQQCSIEVTCRDLAIMASTLANNGVNPVTGKRAIKAEYVGNVLGVMASCGMYDYAGQWIYRVGLPAKSGVGGGIIAVLPGHLGIGIFSPPLDELGNSLRGIKVCEELSRDLNLHMLRVPNTLSNVIRRTFNGASIFSNRLRTPRQSEVLRKKGSSIRIIELQGALVFSSMERVVREVHESWEEATHVIINFRHVQSMNDNCMDLLLKLCQSFDASGRKLILAELQHMPEVSECFLCHLSPEEFSRLEFSEDLDAAMEGAENEILASHDAEASAGEVKSTAEFMLCENFTPEEITALEGMLQTCAYSKGESILNLGDESTELFFLKSGLVSVIVEREIGQNHRVVTYSPGMSFGEVSFVDRSYRTASVQADTDIECEKLSTEDFGALTASHPQLAIKLLQNIGVQFAQGVRRNNRALRVYSH